MRDVLIFSRVALLAVLVQSVFDFAPCMTCAAEFWSDGRGCEGSWQDVARRVFPLRHCTWNANQLTTQKVALA